MIWKQATRRAYLAEIPVDIRGRDETPDSLLVAVFVGHAGDMRRPVEFADWSDQHPGFGPYAAVVRHVVDGDTLDLLVDVGFNVYPYEVIRLRGIDAPEKNREATKVAGVAAMVYLESLLPIGTKVLLITRPDPDSFGRYIGDVIRVSDKMQINEQMIASGHAERRPDYD
jgi:micrococcal nuclease